MPPLGRAAPGDGEGDRLEKSSHPVWRSRLSWWKAPGWGMFMHMQRLFVRGLSRSSYVLGGSGRVPLPTRGVTSRSASTEQRGWVSGVSRSPDSPSRRLREQAHGSGRPRNAFGLLCVGVDRTVGCLEGEVNAGANEGLDGAPVLQLSLTPLVRFMEGNRSVVLPDGRGASGFGTSHIGGAVNMPAPCLRTWHAERDQSLPVAVTRSPGNQSSRGTSLTGVPNVEGGVTSFAAVGGTAERSHCAAPHCPERAGRAGGTSV